jgi:hypothetical protein
LKSDKKTKSEAWKRVRIRKRKKCRNALIKEFAESLILAQDERWRRA